MKVVLLKTVKGVGAEGDAVNVADGHAINFLLPQKVAVKATPEALEKAEKIRAERIAHKEEIMANAKKYADKIKGASIKFKKKTTDGTKLFGAINEKDIIDAVEVELKIALEKKQVKVPKHIKEIGKYEVEIHLAEDIYANLKIEIEAETDK